MSREPPKWYDHKADNPPWIKALAEVRHLAPREGYCFHHCGRVRRRAHLVVTSLRAASLREHAVE